MHADKTKAEIRNLMLKKRNGLSADERIRGSMSAADLANGHIVFEPGTVISGFFPIRSEIDPRPLMDLLRGQGAILCLPVVVDKTRIIFRELVRGAALIETGFGTKGPGSDARIVDPQIMLMPLSVFDSKGGRIGYGAGYYDQAIARLKKIGKAPRTIGMAFNCQQYELVPQERHDIAMDAIVTETGFREFQHS